MQGFLLKKGKKTEMWIKRYYRLQDNTLLIFKSKGDNIPYKLIFLLGTYIEPTTDKNGIKGFDISHDSSYFRRKSLFCKSEQELAEWIPALRIEAEYNDIAKKYEKIK